MDVENLDKADFTATYPDIDDDDFQQKIFDKTEFTILDAENKKLEGDIYFTFQRNIGILLSPVTPYKRILFFLSVATGKSCASILVHELTKEFLNGIKRQTVIITKGKSLEDNFKNEFIKRCPRIEQHFSDESGKIIDPKGIKKELDKNFVFKKYGAFTSVLEKSSDEWIKSTFSNRTFILDEIQVVKNGGKMYKQLLRMFDLVQNVTIILMSGTPNTDHPSEGVRIINLLKEPKDRMITGKKFMKKYYKDGQFNTDYKDELLQFYNGYVIHLKQTSDIVPTEFVSTEQNDNFRDFSVYNLTMDAFQENVYNMAVKKTHKTVKKTKQGPINIFQRDEEGNLIHYESQAGGAFMKLAREAAMFCYPDGTFGAAGFKKNMTKEGNKIRFLDVKVQDEILKNLGKYSVSFAKSFEIIKSEPNRVFYIYFDNVNNSGLLLYAKLLELKLGFALTDGKSTVRSSRPKYVKIDGSLKTPVSQILNKVGNKANADGSLVRVVLGSPISGVGLTIPNATRVFIFDSQFTPFDITQIINRINRPGTLKYLEESEMPTDCKAYLFTSSTSDGKSIDLDIYKIAQDKMDLIAPQTELMAQADPFCAISAKRNGVKECYTATPKKGKFGRHDDITTDVLYWRKDEIDGIVNDILDKVKTRPVLITEYFSDHEPMVVYRAVKKLIGQNRIIAEGKILFISGDLIFVDDTLTGDINANWFIQKMVFPSETSLEDLMIQDEYSRDIPLVETISVDNIGDVFVKLSKHTQILIFENAWLTKTRLNHKIKKLSMHYNIDGKPIHILSAEPLVPPTSANSNAIVIEDRTKIREFVDGSWQYFRGDVDDLIIKIKEEAKKQIKRVEDKVDQQYGMYGKYDKHGNFQIVMIDRRSTGKRCHFFELDSQKGFFTKLGAKVPQNFDKMDREERCQLLEKLFIEKNIIIK